MQNSSTNLLWFNIKYNPSDKDFTCFSRTFFFSDNNINTKQFTNSHFSIQKEKIPVISSFLVLTGLKCWDQRVSSDPRVCLHDRFSAKNITFYVLAIHLHDGILLAWKWYYHLSVKREFVKICSVSLEMFSTVNQRPRPVLLACGTTD